MFYYNYEKQCWYEDGIVKRCHHPEEMDCKCYGKLHEYEMDKNYQMYQDGLLTLDEFNKRLFY